MEFFANNVPCSRFGLLYMLVKDAASYRFLVIWMLIWTLVVDDVVSAIPN